MRGCTGLLVSAGVLDRGLRCSCKGFAKEIVGVALVMMLAMCFSGFCCCKVKSAFESLKSRERISCMLVDMCDFFIYVKRAIKEMKQIKSLSYGHRERMQIRWASLPVGPGMRKIKGKLGK